MPGETLQPKLDSGTVTAIWECKDQHHQIQGMTCHSYTVAVLWCRTYHLGLKPDKEISLLGLFRRFRQDTVSTGLPVCVDFQKGHHNAECKPALDSRSALASKLEDCLTALAEWLWFTSEYSLMSAQRMHRRSNVKRLLRQVGSFTALH